MVKLAKVRGFALATTDIEACFPRSARARGAARRRASAPSRARSRAPCCGKSRVICGQVSRLLASWWRGEELRQVLRVVHAGGKDLRIERREGALGVSAEDEAGLPLRARAGPRLLTHVPGCAARHVGRAGPLRRGLGFEAGSGGTGSGAGLAGALEAGFGKRPCRVRPARRCAHVVAREVPPRGPGGSGRGGVFSLGKEHFVR